MDQTAKKILKIKPFNTIVFGGDGDLAIRKIYPALFHRYVDNQIKCDFNILFKLLDDGLPSLWCPKVIVPTDEIPVLASGKLDIKACQALVEALR